jgi:hypothetical protein
MSPQEGPRDFLSEEGEDVDFFVSNAFPFSSQWVPNVFSISFALSSTRVQKEKITTYLFWDCPKLV